MSEDAVDRVLFILGSNADPRLDGEEGRALSPSGSPCLMSGSRSTDGAREVVLDNPRRGVPGAVPAGVGFAVPRKRSRPGSTKPK